MLSFTTIAALAAAIPFASAFTKGFNMAAYNADGSCLSQDQWAAGFKKLQTLPQDIKVVRVYASSDCGTLANAVPAAISTGTKILVGVWAEDETHYADEKAALLSALEDYGSDWIYAISVGSEDLYRGDTNATYLASQVHDVRGMAIAMGANQPVGHVDTYTEWIKSENDAVIEACDFLGVDAYPYYQNVSIDVAPQTFWEAVKVTKQASQGKPVWVTETAWPIWGPTAGSAVPSLANAKKYWNEVACKAFTEINIFWFVYQDYSAPTISFGVFGKNGNAKYDLHACT